MAERIPKVQKYTSYWKKGYDLGVSLAHQQQIFSWWVRGPLTKNEQLTALGPDVGIPHWALSYPISLDVFFQPGMPKLSPPSGSWHRPPQGGHNAPHPRSVPPAVLRVLKRRRLGWSNWLYQQAQLIVPPKEIHGYPRYIAAHKDLLTIFPWNQKHKHAFCAICDKSLYIYIYFTNLQLSEIKLFGEEFPRLELGWEISH